MSEADDCLTQLEDAVRAAIEAGAPLAKRVLGPEDLPVKDGYLPAVVVDLGDETPDTLGSEEGGERIQQRRVQLDILIVVDAGNDRILSGTLTRRCRTSSTPPTCVPSGTASTASRRQPASTS